MLSETILDIIIDFQLSNQNIYIGGSIALILQNAIPNREIKDIDLISPIRLQINKIFYPDNPTKSKSFLCKRTYSSGILWELFYNPLAEFIEFPYKDTVIKLSPVKEMLEWKRKFPQSTKHQNDLNHK